MHRLTLLIALGACACASPATGWKAYAACAAAYQVNAALADPGRAASMTAMVSEVADEYLTAAKARHADAHEVEAYAGERAASFRRQPRERVEAFIEACPQTMEEPA
jgi:hypothetical protein